MLVDLGGFGRGANGPVELASAEGVDRIHAGEQPAAIEHLALSAGNAPPDAQAFEQDRRKHRVAILLAFAAFNAQRHALAVDVTHLQRHHLARPQSRAVGQGECRLVFDVPRRLDQASDFLATQDHRQGTGNPDQVHLAHQFGAIQRDVEEEFEADDRGVERDGGNSLIHQMQLIAPQVFDGGVIG